MKNTLLALLAIPVIGLAWGAVLATSPSAPDTTKVEDRLILEPLEKGRHILADREPETMFATITDDRLLMRPVGMGNNIEPERMVA